MKLVPQTLLRFFPKDGFVADVVKLAGGTALGQALVLLTSPLITRLYSPEDLGLLTIYISALSLIAVAASLRYELAIPLPKDDETAANLLILSLIILGGTCALTGVGTWLLRDLLFRWANSTDLVAHLWLFPTGLLVLGMYQVLSLWAIRKKDFSPIAQTKFTQSLGMVLVQLGLGYLGLRPTGLLLGDAVGRGGGSGALAISIWRHSKDSIKQASLSGILGAAKRYYRFPLYSSGSALVNSTGLQVPLFLIAAAYGPRVAGWFGLVQRVMGIPLTLIGQSVAQVYMGELPILVREDPVIFKKLFWKTSLRLLLIGGIPIALVSLSAPWLFVLAFGEEWREAGFYAQLLTIMLVVRFVVWPFAQTLNMLERQKLQLVWDIGRFVLVIGCILLATTLDWPPRTAITLYGIAMTVAYAILFAVISVVKLDNYDFTVGAFD